MPSFTMTDLERLAALVGQGERSETYQHQPDTGTFQPPPPKSDIRRDVYTILCIQNDWVSRAGIAKLLGMRKSPWLAFAIEQLVDAGYVQKYAASWPGGLPVYYYRVAR